jgi:beta-phosphoglucomutase-like phosphatase (HAD superfamily)
LGHSVEAVLLDMDGTQIITEPRNRRVHEVTARKYGGEIKKSDWDFLAGTSDKIIWTHLKQTFNRFAVGEEDYIAEVEDGYIHDQGGVVLRPGMFEVFERAANRGILVATVTNAPRNIALSSLRANALESKMDLIITKDEVLDKGLRTKPAADPYLLAAQILGVNIKNCVIYEDSGNGTRSGLAALGDVSSSFGRVVQIIDPDDHAQFEPGAHAHVYDRDQLIAATYKFIG